MGWFRLRTRWGGTLALFALALQLIVSFGHVHADELAGNPPGIAAVEHAGEPHERAGDTPVPAGDTDTDHHDDHCDICATLHALASAVLATPPPLPTPCAFARSELLINDGVVAAQPRRASFQSRAPPIA